MNNLTGQAIEYKQTLFCTIAGGHDVEHTMRVYRNTLRIAEEETGCDVEIAALAACSYRSGRGWCLISRLLISR